MLFLSDPYTSVLGNLHNIYSQDNIMWNPISYDKVWRRKEHEQSNFVVVMCVFLDLCSYFGEYSVIITNVCISAYTDIQVSHPQKCIMKKFL